MARQHAGVKPVSTQLCLIEWSKPRFELIYDLNDIYFSISCGRMDFRSPSLLPALQY